ncbi:MAG TPA: GNAT family N-acetyltransferase [Opitutaceae bacterium]|nr:GNAT family N-acetyltransferase [Opitutaceae bacterium]
MELAIRPYVPADLPALYRICLLTGDAGADAAALYADPELLGHYYAAPYAVLEPESCFVLTGEGKVSGYVLGTGDAAEFAGRAEREWFPALRVRLPRPREEDVSADAALLRLIHRGFAVAPGFRDHPAELHIDLLPAAQGRGWGRRLIERFCAEVRARGATGVRLGVSERNAGAIAFYERIGFALLGCYPGWRAYGWRWAEPREPGGI